MDRNSTLAIDVMNGIVALRKESVDRNFDGAGEVARTGGSLSARRAWIEMSNSPQTVAAMRVALRKESVDRNIDSASNMLPDVRRSPQGERG